MDAHGGGGQFRGQTAVQVVGQRQYNRRLRQALHIVGGKQAAIAEAAGQASVFGSQQYGGDLGRFPVGVSGQVGADDEAGGAVGAVVEVNGAADVQEAGGAAQGRQQVGRAGRRPSGGG